MDRRRSLCAEESNDIDYNYLTIEALEDGLTVMLHSESTVTTSDCEYCVDRDNNWKRLDEGTTTESINTGQCLSFRGNIEIVGGYGIGTFTISKKCNLKGNCMSMLFGDNAADNYEMESMGFQQLFRNCTNIVSVSKNFLPATTVSSHSYERMFEGCTSLIVAPDLPATNINYCSYYSMFEGCTSLKQAPDLPATTLSDHCYRAMFKDCTSLVNAPELLATIATYCCYYQMFSGCISLTTAPDLPATTLDLYCYERMFQNCSKLNYIKMLATDIIPPSTEDVFWLWVSGVASTGTFVKHPDMTTLPTGTSGIPSGWIVVDNE